ncbi:MAG: gliding motility-associated C-terminal domain-containing protein [Elusimicrobia bacterium]|nr:gliding motility-associated C-terminal domain-containing protein [Elusimicrobiota bacterium]
MIAVAAAVLYGAAPAFALIGRPETSAVTGGLGISSSTAKILESVVGETSGVQMTAGSNKMLSGHASNSHSPGVPYDLVATTQPVGEGQVRVGWTAVGRDGLRGQAANVVVKIATFPVTYANYESILSSLTVAALSTGTVHISTYSHLVPGPQYYTALRVRDSAGIYGRISSTASFYTQATAPDPVLSLTLQTSTGGAITMQWNMTGDDGSSGAFSPGVIRIDYSTNPAHAFSSATYMAQITTTSAAGLAEYYGLSGLPGNVAYYARVYLGDDVTVYSGLGNLATIVTMAYPPTPAGFSDMSSDGFTVDYTGNNAAGTEYDIQISSYPDFSYLHDSGWITTSSAAFSGLDTNMTYYARGRARNATPVLTSFSDLGELALTLNVARPATPIATATISGTSFTISWNRILYDVYGGTTSIKRYEVYRSTSLSGTPSLVASPSSATFSYTEVTSGDLWYFVKAVDRYNLKSDPSVWLKNSGDQARVPADDGRAAADISQEIGAQLGAEGLSPRLAHQAQYESGLTMTAYKLYYLTSAGDEKVGRDFPADVTLTMPLSRSGAVTISGARPEASYSAYDYAVYYFNGVEDVRIGGSVDPVTGTVTVLTRKTGVFKVKRVVRPQGFRITQTVPRKIFTPNGDGIWDEFNILYENPEGLEISGAKVYDMSGAEIASLRPGSYNSEASLEWDGRRSGQTAPAGIYIYQFKAGDKYYNGTMVLAK